MYVERTRCNNESLKEAIEVFETMAKVLEETIENNKSMTAICRENNLNYIKFRRLVMGINKYLLQDKVNTDTLELPEQDGYERLFKELFGLNTTTPVDYPVDIVETIDNVISTTLNKREQYVINNKFTLNGVPHSLSNEEIGREFNVTKERIRQVEAKALRKLKRADNLKKIKVGLMRYKIECSEAEAKLETERKLLNERIAKAKEIGIQKAHDKNESHLKMSIEEVMITLSSVPLSDILSELTIRAYNCLKRAYGAIGIDIISLKEFVMLSDEDIEKLRNCGAMTQKEIINEINIIIKRYSFGTLTRADFLSYRKK
jgi:hypothetical protein